MNVLKINISALIVLFLGIYFPSQYFSYTVSVNAGCSNPAANTKEDVHFGANAEVYNDQNELVTTQLVYTFNFGDGNTTVITSNESQEAAVHQYLATGDMTATVEVSAPEFEVSGTSADIPVTIRHFSVVILTVENPFLDVGLPHVFQASAKAYDGNNDEVPDVPFTYSYNFGDGTNLSNSTITTTAHQYSASQGGTYTASVIASSSQCAADDEDSIEVKVSYIYMEVEGGAYLTAPIGYAVSSEAGCRQFDDWENTAYPVQFEVNFGDGVIQDLPGHD